MKYELKNKLIILINYYLKLCFNLNHIIKLFYQAY